MARPKSRVSNVRLTGPLAPFPDAYTAKLRGQAHTPLTIVNQLRQVARLSYWLEASGLTAAELTGERVDAFLAFQRAGGRNRGSWSRPGLCACWTCWASWGVGSRSAGAGGHADGDGAGLL